MLETSHYTLLVQTLSCQDTVFEGGHVVCQAVACLQGLLRLPCYSSTLAPFMCGPNSSNKHVRKSKPFALAPLKGMMSLVAIVPFVQWNRSKQC